MAASTGERCDKHLHVGRRGEQPVTWKSFLMYEDALRMGLTSARVHGVLATMLIRREVYSQIRFDPRYDFYYELFDFFMTCRDQGVAIDVLPGAIFEHRPIPYTGQTRRQTGDEDADRARFAAKWGLEPLGPKGFGGRAKARSGAAPTKQPPPKRSFSDRLRGL